jgi:hypothetical protein
MFRIACAVIMLGMLLLASCTQAEAPTPQPTAAAEATPDLRNFDERTGMVAIGRLLPNLSP